MLLDSEFKVLSPAPFPDVRGSPPPPAPCGSYLRETPYFKLTGGWGGARPGAGRPRKPAVTLKPPDAFHWYVARIAHGQMDHADRQLREAGFQLFAPTLFKPATPPRRDSTGVMRPGKPDRVEWLFVRYIIVSLNLSDPNWRAVMVDGVERMICGGHQQNNGVGTPIAIPDRAIDYIRELVGPTNCLDFRALRAPRGKTLKAGTALRMIDGPMPDRVGICEMSDGERVVLLLNLLGRPVRVTVAQSAVEVV